MRCMWSDAMHVVRCGFCLYKKDQFDYKTDAMRCIWSDAMHYGKMRSMLPPPSCDAVHLVRCYSCLYKKDRSDYKPMRCGECDAMRCDAVHVHVTRCGAVRCIWSDAALVCTKKISLITKPMRRGAYDPVRRGAYDPVRRGAYGPMLFLFEQKRSV